MCSPAGSPHGFARTRCAAVVTMPRVGSSSWSIVESTSSLTWRDRTRASETKTVGISMPAAVCAASKASRATVAWINEKKSSSMRMARSTPSSARILSRFSAGTS